MLLVSSKTSGNLTASTGMIYSDKPRATKATNLVHSIRKLRPSELAYTDQAEEIAPFQGTLLCYCLSISSVTLSASSSEISVTSSSRPSLMSHA